MITNVYDELKWRGMIYDYVDGVQELLGGGPVTVYNGFDATADSLHIGHMVPLLALARLQRFGHHPIALAGGGTSMIGDPSGKTSERQLLTRRQIENNVEAIKKQLAMFLDFEAVGNPARVLNNADWLLSLNLVDFLRDTGKYFTVNYMIAKESVKNRLEREDGISFTEFSYMLLQSYDFLHLFEHEGCAVQTGGSDQWGNITAGVELIRRVRGGQAFGMVYPLVTKADGSKFGKTETGTVWLAPERTSPYLFYQFWLNTDDQDVIPYLKYFTFQDQESIQALEAALAERPEERDAQRCLANEVTRLVHGETALERAQRASQVLFGGEISGVSAEEIQEIFAHVPSSVFVKSELEGNGVSIVEYLNSTGTASSLSDARRLIAAGGAYLNNQRIVDANQRVGLEDTIDGRFLVNRKGSKNYRLVRLVD
jgi:tyrosyl-tRNA synthetase